jgi:hypothetical protein
MKPAKPSIVHVESHVRRDGAPVAEHHRTAADHTIKNNWSTKPNTNAVTGKHGTVDPSSKP